MKHAQATGAETFAPFQQALTQGWEKALESFQSLGASRDGRWVMVGQNGNHVGYVAKAYVQPA